MKLKLTTLLGATALSLGSGQAAVTWTGATNNDWNTGTNWDTGTVPTSADEVTIGGGVNVTHSEGIGGHFATLNLAEGATLSFGGSGGDLNGEVWNIDGLVTNHDGNGTYGIGGNGAFLNFGVNGSFIIDGGTQNNFWANGNSFTMTAEIDLNSTFAGTLVEKTFFAWAGSLSAGFGTINASFTEINGLALTQLADNTTPLNPGEYSFQTNTNLGGSGSIGVSYVTMIPEPSVAALLGLSALALAVRRRK